VLADEAYEAVGQHPGACPVSRFWNEFADGPIVAVEVRAKPDGLLVGRKGERGEVSMAK